MSSSGREPTLSLVISSTLTRKEISSRCTPKAFSSAPLLWLQRTFDNNTLLVVNLTTKKEFWITFQFKSKFLKDVNFFVFPETSTLCIVELLSTVNIYHKFSYLKTPLVSKERLVIYEKIFCRSFDVEDTIHKLNNHSSVVLCRSEKRKHKLYFFIHSLS